MPNLIPLPKKFDLTGGSFPLSGGINCLCGDFLAAANVFSGYFEKIFHHKLTVGEEGCIRVLRADGLAPEEYRLSARDNSVTLEASDAAGINHAFSALVQLTSPDLTVPCCDISDKPDCSYRSCMIDLARDWHDFRYLLEYVDMCWFYRISILHLHFTDSESYTLPSRLFPKLSTEGRHYTFEQIAELCEYAFARGVELVPEIDVPGHSLPFSENYPEIFGSSRIIMQTERSMNAMKELFGELCDMFPHSGYVHIGGDEAEISLWCENDDCRSYAEANGIDFDAPDKRLLSERMLAHFVQTMADTVFAHGKQPVAWEGFAAAVNEYVSKDIIMVSWENFYQTTPELLSGGFKIVNGSWAPMYICTPLTYWTQEEVFNWSVYRWKPIHPKSPYLGLTIEIEPDPGVLGGGMLAWGDHIPRQFEVIDDGVRAEQALVEQRAPMLAENTWNIRKRRTYENIREAYEACDAKYQKLKAR